MGNRERNGTLTDGEILKLYFRRDESAVAETDRKYGSYLLRTAERFLTDRRDREECVADTDLGAWNAIPPEEPRSMKAFLTVLLRRNAVNRYRKDNRKRRVPGELLCPLEDGEGLSAAESAADAFDGEQLGRAISAFVSSLPSRRRTVFMCRFYENRSIGETARLLGCSRSTVEKELSAIKGGLRDYLEKEGYSV